LSVSRRGAFVPKFISTSRPKDSLASFQSQIETLLIHPSHHQDSLGLRTLDDGWHETLIIELDLTEFRMVGRQSYLVSNPAEASVAFTSLIVTDLL